MATYKPKGYKDLGAAQALINSAPKDSDFNPYDYIDQSYYKNNARGRMAYQEDLAKLLYLSQINQEDRMNEYNSPAEQAKRMREAGLNPDLLGVSGEPAANVAGYQGNPMDGVPTNLQSTNDVIGIISGVTNIVSSIMTGGANFLSFPTQQLNDALGLANAAVTTFRNTNDTIDITELISSLPTLSRSQKRRVLKAHNSYANSINGYTDYLKNYSENFKAKGDYHSSRLNPYLNQGIFDDPDEELKAYSEVWKPLIDAQNEVLLKELYSKKSKFEYDQSYYSSELGESASQNEQARNDLWKQLRGPINQVLDNLEKYDNKYPWAVYARAAIGALLMNVLK